MFVASDLVASKLVQSWFPFRLYRNIIRDKDDMVRAKDSCVRFEKNFVATGKLIKFEEAVVSILFYNRVTLVFYNFITH